MHRHHFFFRAMRHGWREHDARHGWAGDCRHDHEDDGYEYYAGRGPFGRHSDRDFFAEWNGLHGGGRRGGGRMLGHGDLKLLLLALIEQQPRHGYELIRTIEEMFHGHYS